MTRNRQPQVVVAGGGVAALEFVLALRALAGDAIQLTVVAPDPDFVLRPALVAAPLGVGRYWRRPLSQFASELGFSLVTAAVRAVDHDHRRIIDRTGDALGYDTLVLALGARTLPTFDDAIHLGDAAGAEGFRHLRDEIESGDVRRVGFVIPSRAGWTLPVYEAALLTANGHDAVSVSLFTPEDRPLERFGAAASDAVAAALEQAGIEFAGGGQRFDPLTVDRVVSVPLVRGPEIAGVPTTTLYGLIPVDSFGHVVGLRGTYAIGDATDFPVKQGEIACQQADIAAQSVAALYGHATTPKRFEPELRATLHTGKGDPLLLNGGQGPDKLPGAHLGPYLARWAQTASQPV
ncbi:FAD-dependent oxidoreductase [Solirubrobacter soli]|uniref:FAD-dependent oxidoreductase n=1 Tax=Solirubrobacter soli TaxID=363832 RepID=UPI00040AC712|nr:FAD-dependent oxidoreductase [Solirubrobacter soli]